MRPFSRPPIQDYHLNQWELAELRAAHRAARNARAAYRLNAVILLGSGWSPAEVAAALFIDDGVKETKPELRDHPRLLKPENLYRLGILGTGYIIDRAGERSWNMEGSLMGEG